MLPVNCFRLFHAVSYKYHIKRRENHAHYFRHKQRQNHCPEIFLYRTRKMNKILEEGGSTKKWTPEEYVKEQFEKAIKEDILRPDDKVK